MPRHILQPLPRAFAGHRDASSRRQGIMQDEGVWERMDRCQVLGEEDSGGHTGLHFILYSCVNALSWSDDGSTLLSGSDDKRICIWASDPSSSDLSSSSPHPLKLVDVIATGHRANIFSARFLPNASTPTIVTCAGDRDIRVFEVERLGRSEMGMGMGFREELWGRDGPGVRVLKCHNDRTKRIATENSPFMFLTVSEDGTVRQHDLRRPHRCRTECPDPLFRAPAGVDLYSLSVSTVTPHIFAVAGRTDTAFVCDRRMVERQSPSWGPNIKSSGQVHCVRRLGLSNEQWESAGLLSRGSYTEDRHITCVKMSPDHADEVICAFAQHSTSIFSTYDSPQSESMRHRSPSIVSSGSAPRIPPGSPRTPNKLMTAHDFERSPRKRRKSEISTANTRPAPAARQRTTEGDEDAAGPSSPRRQEPGFDDVQDLIDDIIRDAQEAGDDFPTLGAGDGPLELPIGSYDESSTVSRTPVVPVERQDPDATSLSRDRVMERFEQTLDAEDLAELRQLIEGDDDDDEDEDDFDGLGEEMDLDEFLDEDDEELDEDDFGYSIDEDDEDDDVGYRPPPARPPNEFASVDVILPRRSFRGARNAETVKDCNFLGARSEKVCSGSDDGNFFVWDKETGKLEGIWEGDGHIVNVMEQHPTLPLVAVSGIDNTVKLFAPLSQRPDPSFSRLHLRESILKANLQRPQFHPGSAFGRVSLLDFLRSRGMAASFNDGGDGEDEQQCLTQ